MQISVKALLDSTKHIMERSKLLKKKTLLLNNEYLIYPAFVAQKHQNFIVMIVNLKVKC